jgi:DNA-binding NarL/FixJ family response regulator
MQKVFLVDDSPLVRERIAAMLAGLPQFSLVGEAADVPEAISGILAAKPDLVLLDLSLEHGSGFDVLKAVCPVEPGICFYMLSNFASEPYRRHAERLGARGFFDKSTDMDRVRALFTGEAQCQPS